MKIEVEFIDAIADSVMEAFGAPGLSIAVCTDGDIVSRACGVADVNSGEKLTSETAFTVGSPAKAFTALAMAILREQGLLNWDDPVARHAGDLCGGELGQKITIRDILSHQSGFGWHDPLWYNSPWDRASVIRKAWLAGPAKPPRTGFQYCNLTYMLAGEIVARVSGQSYESFVKDRIFQPLGLESAHFSGEPPPCPVAQPHTLKGGVPCRIGPLELSKANAACGLRISAPDLAVWLTQFSRSNLGAIPAGAFESVVAPQIGIGPVEGSRFYSLFGEPDWVEYGFGWFLRRYRGHRVIFHTGRLPGAGTHAAILPDLGFGIVALTNLTFACLSETVVFSILERFVGGPSTDWISYYRDVSKQLAAAANTPIAEAQEPQPSSDVREGDYFNPAYGLIEVRKHSRTLTFAWANYRGDLLPVDGAKFALMNLNCSLMSDGELVEFDVEPGRALSFLGRRFELIPAMDNTSVSSLVNDLSDLALD
jgi:CubicO group peptidase (beta-lactamase class C family)